VNVLDNLLDKTARKEKTILYVLSGVLPVIILGAAFALNGIYPFGGNQIIVGDFFDQYFPFASDYWHKLREGGSLLWSWTAGAGHDYYATLAYFIASPFNLLAALFPHAMLREVLTVFLLVKIGLAGLFMSMYLRYASMHSASRIKNQESRIVLAAGFCVNIRAVRFYTRVLYQYHLV
jgi:uncharacterized membrane protein YfhO